MKCDRDCDHNSQGYCQKLEECQIEHEAIMYAINTLFRLGMCKNGYVQKFQWKEIKEAEEKLRAIL